ncbi:TPM domain-containing protein [Muricauda sp. JGD-17]|uniref:TPM domain-containing protein n=2 Tax=Flagellimonas ochracea TaxID=2696472 RepID=A0A964WXY0_9FLAO|nr:TPM domain-containing protein [Allomuricauda ochracea]
MVQKVSLYFFLLFVLSVTAQEKYLTLSEIVTDNAKILTPEQLSRLRSKLTQFEKETTHQLVVLTIEALPNETIEQYTNGTFNQNKLGQKDKDNGILILFAEADREVRMEVGYGLESYITDAVASRIIRNTMIPNFKEEEYFAGIDLATDQIILLLTDSEALEEFKKEIEEEGEMGLGLKIFVLCFLSIFVAAGGFIFYKTYSNIIEVFRGIFIGKLGLIPGLLMAAFSLIPVVFSLGFIIMPLVFATVFLDFGLDLEQYEYLLDNPRWIGIVLIGFLLFTILLAFFKILLKGKEDFKLSWLKNDKKYMSKTFSSGGTHSFGSSSGSGSSGSSSFSGGGGSSGGGGASGSW